MTQEQLKIKKNELKKLKEELKQIPLPRFVLGNPNHIRIRDLSIKRYKGTVDEKINTCKQLIINLKK